MAVTVTVDYPHRGVCRARWTGLEDDDTGDAAGFDKRRDRKVVQVTGTFDSQTVALEGSLDGTTFAALSPDGATPFAIAAAGIFVIFEDVRFVRPVISDEGGTVDIDVTIEAVGID